MSDVDPDRLRISGLTGVDVELDVAGAGSRSYAFIIDWHIRLLLSLAAYLVVSEFYGYFGHGTGLRRLLSIVFVLPVCIYLLYHPILEIALRGRTPGKRSAGVRIVTREGGTPSIGALLIRNVFRLIDCLPGLYAVGLICCVFTQRHVRIGDMAAGTLLVRENAAPASALGELGDIVSQSGLAPEVAELIHDVLQRWPALEAGARRSLARTVLARADRHTTPEALNAFTDAELQQRLRALLGGVAT